MPDVTFSVSGTGTGVRQDVDVIGSGHVIRSDAYPAFGGRDEFPSPLAYTLASLTTCSQVTASIVAKELGISIANYAFEVSGGLDPTAMTTGTGSGDDTFHDVRLTATVDTDATQAQIDVLGAEVERRCPVSALFRRAGTGLTTSWTVRTPVSV